MFQVVTGKVNVGGTVRLTREAAVPIVATAVKWNTEVSSGTPFVEYTVPAGKVYRISEVSVGGDSANRVSLQINSQTIISMFYPAYGMNHKTFSVMPKVTGGQTVRVQNMAVSGGSHTATIIFQDTTGE